MTFRRLMRTEQAEAAGGRAVKRLASGPCLRAMRHERLMLSNSADRLPSLGGIAIGCLLTNRQTAPEIQGPPARTAFPWYA